MAWRYSQESGKLTLDGVAIGTGYSGWGDASFCGRNNPDMEHVPFRGPIPRGWWHIGPSFNHPTKGPRVMKLTPIGHNAFGRLHFLIHGDNNISDASEGCIVLEHKYRTLISKSADRDLEVTL